MAGAVLTSVKGAAPAQSIAKVPAVAVTGSLKLMLMVLLAGMPVAAFAGVVLATCGAPSAVMLTVALSLPRLLLAV